jgi:hypothetical protein
MTPISVDNHVNLSLAQEFRVFLAHPHGPAVRVSLQRMAGRPPHAGQAASCRAEMAPRCPQAPRATGRWFELHENDSTLSVFAPEKKCGQQAIGLHIRLLRFMCMRKLRGTDLFSTREGLFGCKAGLALQMETKPLTRAGGHAIVILLRAESWVQVEVVSGVAMWVAGMRHERVDQPE